jgi:hypothetical protein
VFKSRDSDHFSLEGFFVVEHVRRVDDLRLLWVCNRGALYRRAAHGGHREVSGGVPRNQVAAGIQILENRLRCSPDLDKLLVVLCRATGTSHVRSKMTKAFLVLLTNVA